MATRNEPAVLTIQGTWEELFGNERSALERILPDYLRPRRWFGGKTKDIRSVTLKHVIPIRFQECDTGMRAILQQFLCMRADCKGQR